MDYYLNIAMMSYSKILFSSFLLFLSINSNCQEVVTIEYKVQISDEADLFKDNPNLRSIFTEIVNSKEKPTFSLTIIDGNSHFSKNSGISDNNSSALMDGFAGYTGESYTLADSVYRKNSFIGSNVFQKSKNIENWIITNESKLIDNFLCFKATNIKKVDAVNGKIFNHPVTAWFCPKIPFQLGPNGYGNLPGLILELQVRNVNYAMLKIDFHSSEKFNINVLKRATMMSESEINLIYDNNHKKDGEIIKKSTK